jgi:aspartate aminotransferase
MTISKKIKDFMEQGSWIRKMFEEGEALKQTVGKDNIYDLSLGNPVISPPKEFYIKLRELASDPIDGMHRYMPNSGYPETRSAVAKQLKNETGLNFDSSHLIMTVGAGGALNVVMKTILDAGDEVIIFAPYFVEYIFYADNHNAKCRVVNSDSNFVPKLHELENAITPKTKMILICSPGNPTGVIYKPETLSAISNILSTKEKELGTEITLVSDEPYRKIIFDNIDYPHIFNYHHKSIVATSHSKDLSIPGERIGYIAVNPNYKNTKEIIDGLTFCNRTLGFVNAPALMQRIIASLQNVAIDVSDYERKRDFLFTELRKIGYSVVKPDGAFYMFPKSPTPDEIPFVEELKAQRVLVVPGTGFGTPGHFRIAYCVEDYVLQNSIVGFKKAFEKSKPS